MKTALKMKFLLYLFQPNHNQGFTKLGLLVCILIYGSALTALSSSLYIVPCESCHKDVYQYSQVHLGQANKGKQAEGKQYVSSINKSQQAYYTENGQFVTSE